MLHICGTRFLQNTSIRTPLKKLAITFTVLLIACSAPEHNDIVNNIPLIGAALRLDIDTGVFEDDLIMTENNLAGDLESVLLQRGYTSFSTALSEEGLLSAIDDSRNSWTILAPKESSVRGASSIDSRGHIILDLNLSFDEFSKLATVTTVSGNDYKVSVVDGITTVGGMVVAPLHAGNSSTLLAIDGILD